MIKEIIQQALPGFEALFAAALTLALAVGTKWINAHAKNAVEAGILQRLEDSVGVVVREAEQTLVVALKAKGTTGSLTSTDAQDVLNAALANLKTHLGAKGIAEIEKVIQPGNLNTMLIGFIEAEVNDLRRSGGQPLTAAVLTTEAS